MSVLHKRNGSVSAIFDFGSASVVDLIRYIEEDISAMRYRMETGSYPAGVCYDLSPAELIAAYAAELKERGY